MTSFVRRSLWLLAALSLGCGVSPSSGAAPTSLAEVRVPETFTFATTQPVTLEVTASAAVLPEGQVAGLSIRNVEGAELYRGPLAAGIPFRLKLAVPTAYARLDARLATTTGEHATSAAIAGASATIRFE